MRHTSTEMADRLHEAARELGADETYGQLDRIMGKLELTEKSEAISASMRVSP